jgi:diacylglycerol kinase
VAIQNISMIKIIRSFAYAWNGILHCFKSEINFKCHCFFALTAILLGIALHISMPEWVTIILTIAFVVSFELINTAIEKLCDVVHPDKHLKIKIIKDMAAAAVLISAVAALVIGGIIFLPKMI